MSVIFIKQKCLRKTTTNTRLMGLSRCCNRVIRLDKIKPAAPEIELYIKAKLPKLQSYDLTGCYYFKTLFIPNLNKP